MNFILKNFSIDELENLMVQHKYPKYRAHQIYEWLYKHNAINATIMKNLPSKLKFFLDQECTFETLSLSNKSACEGTVARHIVSVRVASHNGGVAPHNRLAPPLRQRSVAAAAALLHGLPPAAAVRATR